MQAYVMDQIFDKMTNNEAAVGVYYAGDYLIMVEDNPDLVWVQPEEGANWFVDSMCVPTTCKIMTTLWLLLISCVKTHLSCATLISSGTLSFLWRPRHAG